eukprot:TRINITY_DN103635_c0_g1_i1.p1 TRINITY_DN103635_c0_g1~~TRINITY_DN103635_c0_g1_i1.p1  ORF type:complete len:618 (+),score=42.33 TRINITY_DN103635_c0_g1_i1:46-1899(+)
MPLEGRMVDLPSILENESAILRLHQTSWSAARKDIHSFHESSSALLSAYESVKIPRIEEIEPTQFEELVQSLYLEVAPSELENIGTAVKSVEGDTREALASLVEGDSDMQDATYKKVHKLLGSLDTIIDQSVIMRLTDPLAFQLDKHESALKQTTVPPVAELERLIAEWSKRNTAKYSPIVPNLDAQSPRGRPNEWQREWYYEGRKEVDGHIHDAQLVITDEWENQLYEASDVLEKMISTCKEKDHMLHTINEQNERHSGVDADKEAMLADTHSYLGQKVNVKRRCESDIQKISTALSEAEERHAASAKQYAASVETNIAEIAYNEQQQARIWVEVSQLEDELHELAVQRNGFVQQRIRLHKEEEKRIADYESYCQVAKAHLVRLEELRDHCFQSLRYCESVQDSSDKGFAAVRERYLSNQQFLDKLQLENATKWKDTFQKLVRLWTDIGLNLMRARVRLTKDMKTFITSIQGQLKFCLETGDPSQSRYREVLQALNYKFVQLRQTVMETKTALITALDTRAPIDKSLYSADLNQQVQQTSDSARLLWQEVQDIHSQSAEALAATPTTKSTSMPSMLPPIKHDRALEIDVPRTYKSALRPQPPAAPPPVNKRGKQDW